MVDQVDSARVSHDVALANALKNSLKVTAKIDDEALRDDVERLLAAETLSRFTLQAIDLRRFEHPDYEGPELEAWDTVAQPVRSAIMALHELRATASSFGATAHLSLERGAELEDFQLAPSDATPAPAIKDSMGRVVDRAVSEALAAHLQADASPHEQTHNRLREHLNERVGPLADILNGETQRFTGRLRNPTVIAQRWILLGDLQEFKAKFIKLLNALRVAVFSTLSEQPSDELKSLYQTECDEAITLRSGVAELMSEFSHYQSLFLSMRVSERPNVLAALDAHMTLFAQTPAFFLMRAPDKRCVIEFRHTLARLVGRVSARVGHPAIDAREALEDFSRFLDLMRAINRREVLMEHDSKLIPLIHQRMVGWRVQAKADDSAARRVLVNLQQMAAPLFGRDESVDRWLRAARSLPPQGAYFAELEWISALLERVHLG